MSSPGHTPRPILQPIRRSFTVPIKPPPSSVQTPAIADPSDSAAEVRFSHPSARVISFSPPASSHASTPGRVRAASSPIANDVDYPVDAVEILPWYSPTETTVARGLLIIEKVRGSASFLKCQQILHPLMKNSQCWCVDGVSKFVLRVRALQYYRIELPSESETEKAMVEEFQIALKKILRYEITPCPFQRGFRVELPDEACTPTKKKAWTPRKSMGAVSGLRGSETTTDSENVSGSRPQSSMGLVLPSDETESEEVGVAQDGALSDRSVSPLESGTFGRDRTPEPTEPSIALTPRTPPKVKAAIDVFEQEAAKAAQRRDSWVSRTPSSAHLPAGSERSRSSTSASSLASDTPNDVKEFPSSRQERSESMDDNAELERMSSSIENDQGTQEDSSPRTQPELVDMEAVETPEDEPSGLVESELASEDPQTNLNDNEALNEEEACLESNTQAAEHDLPPSPVPIDESKDEMSAASTSSDNVDQSSPMTESDINSPIFGIPREDFVNLTVHAHSCSAVTTQERKLVIDAVKQSEPLAIPGQTSNLDAESITSSVESFHSVASMDFGNDAAASSSSRSFQSPRSMSPLPMPSSPPSHKRDLSNLTVTADGSESPVDNEDDELKPLQDTHAINLIPPTPSSAAPHWPGMSPSSPADSIGLRRRGLKPRRSLSPLPHPSTLLTQPQSTAMSNAVIQKAAKIAIGKPIEMVLMLMHVLGRIAGGATVADLLSGDLFRHPSQNSVQDDGSNSGDEDDFGVPIRGRDRSRDSVASCQRRLGTRTPSELD